LRKPQLTEKTSTITKNNLDVNTCNNITKTDQWETVTLSRNSMPKVLRVSDSAQYFYPMGIPEIMNLFSLALTKSSFTYQYCIGKGGFGKVWKVERKKTK